MSEMMIFWLVLLILCLVVEAFTLGLTSIWFAGGALFAIFATLLHAPVFVQVILFFIVSLLMLFFTRPLAVKYFNKDRVKTNVESMVGRQAIVTGAIDNLQAVGQVTVNGQEWSARSCDDNTRIPEGTVVNVVAISGVKLIVRRDERLAEVPRTVQAGTGAEVPQTVQAGTEAEAPKAAQAEAVTPDEVSVSLEKTDSQPHEAGSNIN